MRRPLVPTTLITASLVLLLAAALVAVRSSDSAGSSQSSSDRETASASAASNTPATPATPADSRSAAITAAQARLRTLPKDYETWAQLGGAYVQQARITGDPSFYPKAEGALQRALQLKPENNVTAMIGQGALANARHEFSQALTWGRRAIAVNPSSASAYGVVTDALTQLGDYSGADAALQKMLDLQPGISAFTRASYAFEQRGQVTQARDLMQRALAESTDRSDLGFCRYYLGELAFNSGDPTAALRQYELGLSADPASTQLLAGKAKAEAALGRVTEAVRDYAAVVTRVPLPEYILEYGQYLESLGRADDAAEQYSVLATVQQLFSVNGVVDDLTAAAFEADHGSATQAVRHAQLEWDRRHSVLVADALAWALHRAGRDSEASRYARQADRLGWRNATFSYHLGMIELSLGQRDAARTHLSEALAINPFFSPVQAPLASAALASLGGPR